MHYELELAKGIERMSTVCSIAHKRIQATYSTLGIPEDIVREDYLVTKNEDTINIVSNTVNNINRMLNLELVNIGVRVATDDRIREMVDEVRSRLAKLIMILGKGCPARPPFEEIKAESGVPIPVLIIGISAAVVAVILALIFMDVDK